jgi:hypothetical protein
MTATAEKVRRKKGPRPRVDVLHNVHFSSNTSAAIKLLSALTDSGGISGLCRTVIECYLASAINWEDPKFRDVDRIVRPAERYKGQHEKLGLA